MPTSSVKDSRALSLEVRRIRVDRTLSLERMLKELRYREHVDHAVLSTLPIERDPSGEIEYVYFFPAEVPMVPEELTKAYDFYGLTPAFCAGFQVNFWERDFSETHPNGFQWVDQQGNCCCFRCRKNEVFIYKGEPLWQPGWWFPGVLIPR